MYCRVWCREEGGGMAWIVLCAVSLRLSFAVPARWFDVCSVYVHTLD